MMTYIQVYCNSCKHDELCKYQEEKEKLENEMGVVQSETPIPYYTALNCRKFEKKVQTPRMVGK